MENHLKTNIKETFKNRTITPKRDLWDELEQQLNEQKTPPVRKPRYYALVACFVGLIAVGLWFIRSTFEQQITENKIITTENQLKNTTENPSEDVKTTIDAIPQETIADQNKIFRDNDSSKENNLYTKNQRDKELDAYIDEMLSDVSADKIIALLNQDVSFENTIDSIYRAMNFQNISAEELLLIASTEMKIDQYVESKINVNTMLQESDKETFKERIKQFFDKVSTEYDKLKYALSND